MKNLFFRIADLSDMQEMQQLLVNTVTNICKEHYDDEQVRAWVSGIMDTQRWLDRLVEQWVLLAILDNRIVGYGTLKDGCYIDLLYTHKDYQGQGIARSIYKQVEERANKQGSGCLIADVSITARPFFEKMGFRIEADQKVERMGVELVNYKMRKIL